MSREVWQCSTVSSMDEQQGEEKRKGAVMGMAHGEAFPSARAGMAARRSRGWGSLDSSQGVARLAGHGGPVVLAARQGYAAGHARGSTTKQHDSKKNENEEQRRELTGDEGLAREEKGSSTSTPVRMEHRQRQRTPAPWMSATRQGDIAESSGAPK